MNYSFESKFFVLSEKNNEPRHMHTNTRSNIMFFQTLKNTLKKSFNESFCVYFYVKFSLLNTFPFIHSHDFIQMQRNVFSVILYKLYEFRALGVHEEQKQRVKGKTIHLTVILSRIMRLKEQDGKIHSKNTSTRHRFALLTLIINENRYHSRVYIRRRRNFVSLACTSRFSFPFRYLWTSLFAIFFI